MNSLIDTSALLLLVRRSRDAVLNERERLVRDHVEALTRDGEALVLGSVRQEILTGAKTDEQFRRVETLLEDLEIILPGWADHVEAASLFNRCRRVGVQAAPVDFLLCAVSERLMVPILSVDRDFLQIGRVVPLNLVAV